jgi:hypothetical protein
LSEGVHSYRHQRRHHSRAAEYVLRVLRPLTALVAFGLVAGGCDIAPEPSIEDGPVVLSSDPDNGDEGVSRLPELVAHIDRQLLPRTVNPGTVRLRSGGVDHRLSVRFDPVEAMIIATSFEDAPLEPEVVYRFSIDGVRDLEDRQIATEYLVRFRSGAADALPPEPPSATWAEVAPIFSERCGVEGCHLGLEAPFGLDLSSPERIRETAIGRRSPRGGGETLEANRGSVFLGALNIIDVVGGVGRPDGSLLIYKVLGDPHVLGARMPPPEAGAPLTHEEIATLSHWILAGAPME